MKANLKGLGNVKGLLLAHGEKLGIAIVGLCALMFIYSTLSHEPLPDQYQADQLKSQIDQVNREVNEAPWPEDPKDENVRISNLTIRAENISVDPLDYPISESGWNPPVIPPTVLRTDPKFLAAMEVKVTSGSGLLAFRDEEISRLRALKEEQEKQEEEKRQEAERGREQSDEEANRRRGREEDDKVDLLDPDRPNLRRVESGINVPGVALNGAERIDTAYWAIIVAKVPIKEQLKLYRDALSNARGYDPRDDVPRYLGYYVERAEVIPGQELLWERVSVTDGQTQGAKAMKPKPVVTAANLEAVITHWAGIQPEVVDSRFLDQDMVLAFPLPPLVWRDWGEEATHPGIPLIENDEALDILEAEAAAEGTEEPGAGAGSGDEFAAGTPREGGRGARSMQSRGGSRSGARRGGGGLGGQGRGAGREMAGRSRGGGRSGGARGDGELSLAPDVTDWLLRFYDFSVQPGKKYVYRVQLVLADPNSLTATGPGRQVSRDDVDQAVVDRQAEAAKARVPKGVVLTAESEPSSPVGIPLSGDVRVAGARAASENLFNDEPRVNMLVQSFSIGADGQAFQAAKLEEDLRRGSVANLTDDVEILVNYGEHIDLLKSFAFRTGIAVLDIRGGERLPARDMTVPAESLLMDPTGQLYVRREQKDSDDVELHTALFAKPDKREGGGRRGDDGFTEGPRGGRVGR